MKRFSIIAAVCSSPGGWNGIGLENRLPWPANATDMNHFRRTTVECREGLINAIVMGANTYASIGEKPLPGRINCVISQKQVFPNASTFTSFIECLVYLSKNINIDQIFVIGGEKLYSEAITNKWCERLIITHIPGDYKTDTRFPTIPEEYDLVQISNDIYYYRRFIDHNSYQEKNYLQLLEKIIRFGQRVPNRTGIDTMALFGQQLKYSVKCLNPDNPNPCAYEYEFPLFTTKRMFLRGIFWELIWFIQGKTNAKWLQEKDVHIWDKNTSANYLTKYGLPYDEGEAGPVYGSQWRNWNGDGIDQLQQIVDTLRNNPRDRRMVLSAWNPSKIPLMALPPCHMTYTFSTIGDRLNVAVDIRSNDMFLGHPFNVSSAALLLIFLSRISGIKPGEIVINITDCHMYINHINQCRELLQRTPFRKPVIIINSDIKSLSDVENLSYSAIDLINYCSWPSIKGDMAE